MNTTFSRLRKHRARQDIPCAFTLVELAALIGVLALLAMAAAPALSTTKPNNRSVQCLSNLRQLVAAWQMYTQDNNDRMVTQTHGGSAAGGAGDSTYGVNWAAGWLDWAARTDNTNVHLLVDERYAKLAKYATDPGIYRCPSDTYVSSAQIARGWPCRVRSYSGNIFVGDGNAETGPTDPIYKQVRKTTEIVYPTPSEAWVFLEEHPDSINDPAFFSPHATSWVDLPAPFHNGATPFAMTDGHVEMHRWQRSLTAGAAVRVAYTFSSVFGSAGDPDIHYVAWHTPRNTTSSY